MSAPISSAGSSRVLARLLFAALAAFIPASVSAQQVDLTLNLSDSPDPVPAGGTIAFAINVANGEITNGATGVEVVVGVPAELRYAGFAGSGVSCSGLTIGQAGSAGPGTPLTCTLPDIAAGDDVDLTVNLEAIAQGSSSVTATVSATQPDPSTGDNSATETTQIVAGADVSIALVAPAAIASGDSFSYTIDVNNAGPDPATLQFVQFPVPTGFDPVGATPAGCVLSGGTYECDIPGPIPALGSASLGPFQGQVFAASGSTISGAASVQLQAGAPVGTPRDSDTDDNDVVANTTVTAGSDVSVTITRSRGGPYFVGETFDFVLEGRYTGDNPTGLTMSATLPANYTIDAGAFATSQNGWDCSIGGQTVTCTRASGGAPGSDQPLGTVDIPVSINADGAGIVASASISSTAPTDPNLANNTDTDGGVTIQVPNADLAASKTAPSPALVVTGVPYEYRLNVSNGGPSAYAGDLTLTDSVPASVDITGVSLNGWACTGVPATGPAEIICTRSYTPGSPLPAGATTPSIVLTAEATTTGVLDNRVFLTTANDSVPDLNGANSNSSAPVTASLPAGSADIRVLKTVDLDPVPAGDVLTYTVEVINDGPITATSVDVTDNLFDLINASVGPTGAGFISTTVAEGVVAAGTIDCSASGSIGSTGYAVDCRIPSLPQCSPGVDCPIFTIAIRPGGDGGLRDNVARAISQDTADDDLGNNAASVQTTVLARADIAVTKTDTPDPAAAGQSLVYVITAENNGPSRADAVTVIDSLPIGVVFTSAIPSNGVCGTTPASGAVTTALDREVICTLGPGGSIDNGAQQTVTVRVRPTNAVRGTTIPNTVRVSTSTTETSGAPANNVATTTTDIAQPSLDLIINKNDVVDPLTVGDSTSYFIVVNNLGPSDAENVVVTDTLPGVGLSFRSASISAGSCTSTPVPGATTGVVICEIPRLASNTTATLEVVVRGEVKGVYSGTAAVASDETALGPAFEPSGNNTAGEATTVRTRVDLEVVSVTPTPASVELRRDFDVVVLVRNNTGLGLAEADSTRYAQTLPPGFELTGPPIAVLAGGTTTTLNSCTGTAGDTSFTCDFGEFSNGGEITITVPVRAVSAPAGGTADFPATISSFSADIDPTNDTNVGTVTIPSSSLSGRLFRDFDNDGVVDGVDTGISGIPVTLSGLDFRGDPFTAVDTTDVNGQYAIEGVPEGTYTVTRAGVAEAFLTVGQQGAGDRGGDAAAVVGEISGISIGGDDSGTGYLFGFVPEGRIGLAKQIVGSQTVALDSSFTVQFRLRVENFSLEPVDGVAVTDDLAGVAPDFGTYVAGGAAADLTQGEYTIQTAPGFDGVCTNGTTNASFDGDVDPAVATITSIAAGATCDIDVTLRYHPVLPLPGAGYANQASISGTGAFTGDALSDLSTNGGDPDLDADDDPRDDNVPTPVTPTLVADVETTLTFPPATDAGETVAGTVVFRNGGPYTAEGVTYGLVLSPGLTDVVFSNLPGGATATYDPGTGVVTFTGMPTELDGGEIASGDGTNGIGVSYTQNAAAASTVDSTIGTTTSQGPDALPDAATAPVGGVLIADVTTEIDLPAFVTPGDPVNALLTFRNDGPSVASGMTYGLTLSPGLTGVTFGNLPGGATATYDPGTGVVTFGGFPATLAPGALASGDGTSPITLVYDQLPSGPSSVATTVGTTTSQGANAAPDAASGQVFSDSTIGLAKAASARGDTVQYEIKLKNTGTAPATDVEVDDDLDVVFGAGNYQIVQAPVVTLPPTLGSIVANPSFDGTPAGLSVLDPVGPNALPPGDSAIVAFEVLVTLVTDQGFGAGVFQNSAVSTSSGPGGGTFTDTSTDGSDVDPTANGDPGDDSTPTPIALTVDATVGLAKTATVSGRVVTFDITLQNYGNAIAESVSVIEDLDEVFGAGNYRVLGPPTWFVDPVTVTIDPAFTGSGSGRDLFIGGSSTLAPGGRGIVRLRVEITAVTDRGAGFGQYSNLVVSSSNGPGGTGPFTDTSVPGGDPDLDGNGSPTNDDDPTPFAIENADVVVTKSGPAQAQLGDTIEFTVSARNDGRGVALDVQLVDSLPSAFVFVSASDAGVESAPGVVTWPVVPEVLRGESIVRTLRVEVVAEGTFENVAVSTSLNDPDPTNNDGSDPGNRTTTNTDPMVADLRVVKTGPETAEVGDTVVYRIAVTNDGPDPAADVIVTDSLAQGVEFVSASRGGALTGGSVVFPTLATLGVGETVVDSVAVIIPAAGSYIDFASATASTFDPDSTNNNGDAPENQATTSVSAIDLVIAKRLDTELVSGDTAVYVIDVRNQGTAPTTGPIVVTDSLPAGLEFVEAAGDDLTCEVADGVVTCTRETPLGPDEAFSLTLRLLVTAAPGVEIANTASVATDGEAPGDDNTATTAATPVGDPGSDQPGEGDLSLRKDRDLSVAGFGDVIRYTLDLQNIGDGTVADVRIEDRLPLGFSYVEGSARRDGTEIPDPAGSPGPLLDFEIGDLQSGSQALVSYSVRVGPGASLGDGINRAQAFGAGGLVTSNTAAAAVEIEQGVFTDEGTIIGRVWAIPADSVARREARDVRDARVDRTDDDPIGIPGVRVYLQDGRSAVTDAMGRYSFTDLRPRLWLVRLDPRTLPEGIALEPLTARHVGDGSARFVELTRGELARADFGDPQAARDVVRATLDRVALGPVPDAAVPLAIGLRAGSNLQRGRASVQDQSRLTVRNSNRAGGPAVSSIAGTTGLGGGVFAGPGLGLGGAGTSAGAGGTGVASDPASAFGGTAMSPLFRRPGAAGGMALDPSANAWGGSSVTTGPQPGAVEADGSDSSGVFDFFVTGFLEGRFDLRSLADGELFPNSGRDRFRDALLDFSAESDDGRRTIGGRAAAFATGEIADGWNLTLRLDTERDESRRFFDDIRPEENYDVFGDASSLIYEAQSRGRLFAAVERGGSYLMYGDYNTATYTPNALLGRYTRTLNGVQHSYATERFSVRTFASRDSYRQVVDELPALGISGPYELTRSDGLLNSERVEILTRDRNQPSLILNVEPLERFTDYTIEPFTGRLVFRRPIPSVDDRLNPVSIRVSYESETGTDPFWVVGTEGTARVGDRLLVGGSVVRDDDPDGRYDLVSVNASVALGDATSLTTEFARSSLLDQTGEAVRADVTHRTEAVDVRGFVLRTDTEFLNASAGLGAGRTEMGVTGQSRLGDQTLLTGEFLRSEANDTDATLTGGRLGLARSLGERFTASLGYRHAEGDASSLLGADSVSVRALGARLSSRFTDRAALFAEYEQDLREGDARRLGIGADLRLFSTVRLYGRHELLGSLEGPYQIGAGQERNTTVFGLSADYAEGQNVFSEYRVGNGLGGRGAHAALGLRNAWVVREGVRLNTSLERVSPIATDEQTSTGPAFAVAGAVEVTTSRMWKATLRTEYRGTDAIDQVLTTLGYGHALTSSLTLLAQSAISQTLDGGPLYERTRLGLAWRGNDRNSWNALARYEHRTDRDLGSLLSPLDRRAHVLSTHANVRVTEPLTLRAQYAAKFSSDRLDLIDDQTAQLVSGRATLDLTDRVDVGLIGRSLFGEGADQTGVGVEFGIRIGADLRLGAGYNWFGFTDDALDLDEYTDRGLFIDLGWAFDEGLFGFDRRIRPEGR